MKKPKSHRVLLLVVIAVVSAIPIVAQNQRSNRSVNTRSNGDFPTSCGDLQVTFDRRPAITDESQMTLAAAGTLKADITRGGIYVQGWDRGEISVKTCKAVPDEPDAAQLRDINTVSEGGRLTVTGPGNGEWTASLIIMVPRLSNLDLDAINGPLSLRDMAGVLHLSAKNGPVSLNNIGGVVDTIATNGPISLRGISGDQKVSATNGPINVALSGNRWDGPGLEVSARNGPMTVSIPDAYGSGVQINTNDRSPVNCKLAACAEANRRPGEARNIRIGNGAPVVRLSTQNGPLSIQSGSN